MNEVVLKIDNLTKTFGALRAVDDVSFMVRSGEVFGLLGPNGAGKTTIISTIVGLEIPDQGVITITDKDITRYEKETKSIMGFVPQEVISPGYFNIEELLCFQSGYYGLLNNTKYIHKLLKDLDLWSHRHKRVRYLSGGMKRRLMIAKALLHSPKLLLLDEPTAGVDVKLRHSIWEQVRNLKKQGVGILFTTHYLEEAEQLCDHIAIIHEGVIKKRGKTKEFIQKLTSRHITILLNTPTSCSHPALVNYSDTMFEFRIPYSINIGQFLSELNWSGNQIQDLKIREGTLEDAFKYVLSKDSNKHLSPTTSGKL